MLSDNLKDRIREAYRALVDSKQLSPRWGQRQMIAEIANTLARIPGAGGDPEASPVCVIEAGTGTGKTIAYAVAGIPLAQALGKRFVVATATVALQEQFVYKDLPDIAHHSGLEFSFALAKGRRRYICLSKLDKLLASDRDSTVLPLYPDEFEAPGEGEAMPHYQAMIDALGRGDWDGDRDNWTEALDEPLWFSVTTDHNQCSGRRCPNISQCSFFKARDALQQADVIVANHDLVLSDLALGGGAILPAPEDAIYVFDEGHHLPDKALNHFAGFCRLHTTRQWLEDCKKQLAQGAQVMAHLTDMDRVLQRLPGTMDDVIASLQVAEQVVAGLFDQVDPGEADSDVVLRLEHGLVPAALQAVANTLAEQLGLLGVDLDRLESRLQDAIEGEVPGFDRSDAESWHIGVGAMVGRGASTAALWREFSVSGEGEDPPTARWITLLQAGGQFGFDLRCSPILAGDILRDCLWTRAAGVIITSATLTALSSFDRFRLRSGAPEDAIYKVVQSPFNYADALLQVPAMDCDPSDAQAHTEALVEQLPGLVNPSRGALVLFSSRRQMLDVYNGLSAALGEQLLMQGDYSKQEILRRHRVRIDEGEASVIFGLASFAEGVDLPGDYCTHVVIAKIPFAVPDNPLEAALSEWVEARGGNPFMEISVPDAALRLVQASGRLLRTEQDRGTVTLMDRRIVTKRYGRAILDSLPPFERRLA